MSSSKQSSNSDRIVSFESTTRTLDSSRAKQLFTAIDENDLEALTRLLSDDRGRFDSHDWIRIVSRAFLQPHLATILNCLSTIDSVALVVRSRQDISIPFTLRGNTCLHWLFEWYNLMTMMQSLSPLLEANQLNETLEHVFSMLLPMYESNHDLIQVDALSPDPLIFSAISSPECFRLFSILYERHHVALDRLDSTGISALHAAIAIRNLEAIDFLIKHCPQLLDQKDLLGRLPSEWAESHGIDLHRKH